MTENVPDMISSLQGMGIDPRKFSKEQLEKVMAIADSVQDPNNMTPDVFQKVAQVLNPKKPDYGKVSVNAKCPCGSGKKYKKCCRI